MSKTLVAVLLLGGLVSFGLVGISLGNSAVAGDEPAMMASPSVVVLAKVDTITVHTNIALSAVDAGTVTLNGVAPTGVFADSLGHLVAKFAIANLGLAPGEVTLTLSGEFKDGSTFTASDVVTVK